MSAVIIIVLSSHFIFRDFVSKDIIPYKIMNNKKNITTTDMIVKITSKTTNISP